MNLFSEFFSQIQNYGFKDHLGLWSSIALPFFNIPLMVRLYKRKSSEDLSLIWVVGVFLCLLGILPDALESQDFTYKVFGITNVSFYSGVTFLALYYRVRKKRS